MLPRNLKGKYLVIVEPAEDEPNCNLIALIPLGSATQTKYQIISKTETTKFLVGLKNVSQIIYV